MLAIFTRLREAFAPSATVAEKGEVMLFLRRIRQAGGFLMDGLEGADGRITSLAEAFGYTLTACGAGTTLSPRGEEALRASGLDD